mgnify:CR=1 FL=1|jgi:hypothetical protein
MEKKSDNIKIALIGNMNNNFFGIKRYFEDFGFECTLFNYNNLPDHFHPKNDTWKFDKHEKSIVTLNYGNPYLEVFPKEDKTVFEDFDICIGDGFTPFYFEKMGLELDIFVPYGSDLSELPFKMEINFKSIKFFLISILHNLFICRKQLKGIRKTTQIITINHIKFLKEAFQKINRTSLPWSTPMVYLEKENKNIDFSKYVEISVFEEFSFRIFSHSRQSWGDKKEEKKGNDKGNDELIRGFYQFNKKYKNSCLVLFEYGPSIHKSKILIDELGIKNNVIWVKKMPRKYILALIKKFSSIGADQFKTGYFGSTCYELMSQGTPVLNYVKWTPQEFKEKVGRPFPPIINVNKSINISKALEKYYLDENQLKRLSHESEEYFVKYLGKGAALKYKDEVLRLFNQKKSY